MVTVRAPRRELVRRIGQGTLFFGLGVVNWVLLPVLPGKVSGSAWTWLAIGCGWMAEALWLSTLGVDLTNESAVVRRWLRRGRTIPWSDIQEVVCRRRFGYLAVQLVPQSGRPVTVRVLTARRGPGASSFQSDYEVIGQWFLAHQHGPERSTAPELTARG